MIFWPHLTRTSSQVIWCQMWSSRYENQHLCSLEKEWDSPFSRLLWALSSSVVVKLSDEAHSLPINLYPYPQCAYDRNWEYLQAASHSAGITLCDKVMRSRRTLKNSRCSFGMRGVSCGALCILLRCYLVGYQRSCSSHVPLDGGPGADPGHAGGNVSPSWLEKIWGSRRRG